MRNLLITLLAASVACGGSQSFKDKSRDALPSSDSVTVGTPSSPGGTKALTQESTVNDPSPFFGLTVSVATAFNGSAAIFLGIVERVTESEPTSCTSNSCTWGPGHGPFDYNDYKLVVSQAGDGYDWTLSGRSLQAAPTASFTTIMSGHAIPGPQK